MRAGVPCADDLQSHVGGGDGRQADVRFLAHAQPGDGHDARVSPDRPATLAELPARPDKDIRLYGGNELFRRLAKVRRVDAVEVANAPVRLGGGIRLLPDPVRMCGLRLDKRRVFETTGTVLLQYKSSDTVHITPLQLFDAFGQSFLPRPYNPNSGPLECRYRQPTAQR